MVLAKPEWFGRRKYTGWGLTPKTWQGWAYVLGFIVLILLTRRLISSEEIRAWATGILVVLFLVDVIDTWRQI